MLSKNCSCSLNFSVSLSTYVLKKMETKHVAPNNFSYETVGINRKKNKNILLLFGSFVSLCVIFPGRKTP